ncbi:MAG: hypothetical protein ACLFR2_12915 [Candidatus Kapaibacterium sp.]
MPFEKIKSTNPYDYEVMIRRRGETEYASYCPQLNFMITGNAHEEVENRMREHIKQYIEEISETSESND